MSQLLMDPAHQGAGQLETSPARDKAAAWGAGDSGGTRCSPLQAAGAPFPPASRETHS